MLKRVVTAAAIAVSVLGLAAWDEAAARNTELLTDPPVGPGGGTITASPTPAPPAGSLIIVAAGDSYASGEGAPDHVGLIPQAFWGGTSNDGRAVSCHRSTLAGAANAASRLAAFGPVGFFNFACTGADTSSMSGQLSTIAGEFSRLYGTPPPIDVLVLSIGGNDIGFSGIVANCMIPNLPGFGCDTDLFLTSVLGTSFTALPGLLDSAFGLVNSGLAGTIRHVLVTEYPDPTMGPYGLRCGTLYMPAFEGFDGIDGSEAAWASASVVAPLNAALFAAVNRANAAPGIHPVWHFVSDISAKFRGLVAGQDGQLLAHGYCTGVGAPYWYQWFTPRYVNTPADSLSGQGDHLGTMHPNDLGYQEIGDAIAKAIVSAMTPPPPSSPIEAAPPDDVVCFNKPWTPGCGP